jgi:hypothetical protein
LQDAATDAKSAWRRQSTWGICVVGHGKRAGQVVRETWPHIVEGKLEQTAKAGRDAGGSRALPLFLLRRFAVRQTARENARHSTPEGVPLDRRRRIHKHRHSHRPCRRRARCRRGSGCQGHESRAECNVLHDVRSCASRLGRQRVRLHDAPKKLRSKLKVHSHKAHANPRSATAQTCILSRACFAPPTSEWPGGSLAPGQHQQGDQVGDA